MKPNEIERLGAGGGIAAGLGGVAGLLFGEAEGGLLLICLALCLSGLVAVGAALGYEALVPRVELLRSGQSPRLQRFLLWAGGGIAIALLGSMVTGIVD